MDKYALNWGRAVEGGVEFGIKIVGRVFRKFTKVKKLTNMHWIGGVQGRRVTKDALKEGHTGCYGHFGGFVFCVWL